MSRFIRKIETLLIAPNKLFLSINKVLLFSLGITLS